MQSKELLCTITLNGCDNSNLCAFDKPRACKKVKLHSSEKVKLPTNTTTHFIGIKNEQQWRYQHAKEIIKQKKENS